MREVLRSEARSTSLIAVVQVEIRKYEHHHHHQFITKIQQNKMVTKGSDMSALFRFSQTFRKEVGHSQIIQL